MPLIDYNINDQRLKFKHFLSRYINSIRMPAFDTLQVHYFHGKHIIMSRIPISRLLALFPLILISFSSVIHCRTYLRPDGSSDTYGLINSVWGSYGTGENPDCSHTSFGQHITQGNDGELNKQVFFFHSHVNQDNDRCQNFDRQRNEIRPDQGALTGGNGDVMSFSWIFKLPDGFQPSDSFTHIFQIKAVGGDDSQPVITFTPRRGSPNKMELIYINSAGTTTKPVIVDLAPFLGTWVKAKVYVRYGVLAEGTFSCTLSRHDNGQVLLTYTNNSMQMWRDGANYYRGKWGIYRSLANVGQLRDEIVRFDNICIGKGEPQCT